MADQKCVLCGQLIVQFYDVDESSSGEDHSCENHAENISPPNVVLSLGNLKHLHNIELIPVDIHRCDTHSPLCDADADLNY